jgi:hypothetical protein
LVVVAVWVEVEPLAWLPGSLPELPPLLPPLEPPHPAAARAMVAAATSAADRILHAFIPTSWSR